MNINTVDNAVAINTINIITVDNTVAVNIININTVDNTVAINTVNMNTVDNAVARTCVYFVSYFHGCRLPTVATITAVDATDCPYCRSWSNQVSILKQRLYDIR